MTKHLKAGHLKAGHLKAHVKTFLRWAFLLLVLGCLGAGTGVWFYASSILHRAAIFDDNTSIVIKAGAGRVVISAVLNRAGVLHPPWVMRLEEYRRVLWRGLGGDLRGGYVPKAGEFALPQGTTLAQAMDIIHGGHAVQHRVTIPEGWTSAEIVAALEGDDRFEGLISEVPGEGRLLPETYAFSRGAERGAIIARMRRSQEAAFERLWDERAADLPFATLDEAIILASIVEKETGLAGERGKVASVFINRLRAGMRLQSDPTVLYGLEQAGEKVERLLRRHWTHASAWNTYQVDGLPPSPICNPGVAALRAVLQPPVTEYYYFVADGQGGHAFASSLREHNRNVRAWQRLNR